MQVIAKTAIIEGTVDNGVRHYFGIPYAEPPVGVHRFKKAVALEPSNTRILADHFQSKAFQPQVGLINAVKKIPESEDCLYLNIWTPALEETHLPVLVWIHGGAFVMGEAAAKMYDGDHLAKDGNIIFVSIQYRLGLLGFADFRYLNKEEHRFDANVGLSDQIEALRWIKENIASFGGDPENITVCGESAGASSVLALMTTRIADTLFQKAIVQSAVTDAVLSEPMARFWARKAMEYLGLEKDDAEGLFQISPERAVQASVRMMNEFTDITPGGWPLGPVVDHKLLLETIPEAFRSGKARRMPLIIGTTRNEAANFVRDTAPWLPSNNRQLELFFARNPHLDKQTILSQYPDISEKATLKQFGRDFAFAAGTVEIADRNSEDMPTYQYRFDYETIPARKLGIGAFHGAEIMYAFGNLQCELSRILMYETDGPELVSKQMMDYWIHFIQTGNPNATNDVLWEPYSLTNRKTLSIERCSKMIANPDHLAHNLWHDSRLYQKIEF